jgi:hypothetical protein
MAALDPVIAALEEQVGCYRRLAKLAEVQHGFVQQGMVEELLEVLSKRQAVLEQAQKLEVVIGPAKREWAGYVAGLLADDRATAERLVAETRRLLEVITTADRNDAMVLQQRKLSLGREIGQANAARQVNTRYAALAYGARGAARVNVQR